VPLATKLAQALPNGIIPAGDPGSAGGPGGAAPPGLGSGWEVKVLGAPDYYRQLAQFSTQILTGIQFVKQLNDKGSGTVTLSMDDAFWSTTLPGGLAAHNILDYEHLWQCWQDGVLRFEFLGETITEQLLDASEQRIVTVTGPGSMAALGWAMSMPSGFPNIIYKLDALADGFSETDVNGNLVVDTNLWNQAQPLNRISLNPSGTIQVMGSPSTTYLGTSVYDGTETLISANIRPMVSPNAAGQSLNGSQLTQFYIQDMNNSGNYALMGVSGTSFYCRFGSGTTSTTQVIASAAQFNAASGTSGQYNYDYWMISEHAGTFQFWTSPDGQNWAQQYSVKHSWNATHVAFFFAAQYSVDNTQYATLTSLNSNVTNSSLGGTIYLSQPIMSVFLQNLQQSQARGTVPFITTKMTTAHDSFGNPWTDTQSVQIAPGTDLFSLLQGHASMVNADFIMEPGFVLKLGVPVSGKITLGADRSQQIIFREARDESAKTRTRTRATIANLIGVQNADGRTVTTSDSTSIANWAQREAWLSAGVQVTEQDIAIVASASVQQTAGEQLAWTMQIIPNVAGKTVFRDFQVGDWVGLERPDYSAVDAVRVIAIAVSVDSTGIETHELTLVSYIAWLQEQFTYIQQKMGGNLLSVNGTTQVAGGVTSRVTPTVFAPTLAGLGDVLSAGAQGQAPLVYDPVTGKWVPAGTQNPDTGGTTVMSVSTPNGTTTISGGSTTVAAPTVAPADTGTPAPVASTVTTPNGHVITDSTGTQRVVIGAQSDGTVTVKTVNAPAPAAPSTPTCIAGALGVIVGWDGLLGGAGPLSDFKLVQVHGSTTTGFTPSPATLQGTMIAGGLFGVGNLAAGTAYYVKLVALNLASVAGPASAQATATPTSVGGSITPGSLNGNVITTGTLTGSQLSPTANILGSQLSSTAGITAGQVAFTASAIGGGPAVTVSNTAPASPNTNDLWFDGSNGYELKRWTGAAWTAYQYGTAAIASGAIGGAQLAGTVTARSLGGITTTIAASAPGSPTTGDLWINSASGNQVNQWTGAAWSPISWNAANVLSANSITPALLNATVTARALGGITTTIASSAPSSPVAGDIWLNSASGYQINQYNGSSWVPVVQNASNVIQAGTIAGNLIAASTITAGNIAAGTITAAQIQTGSITSAQIAANTITAGDIAAGTITGAQIQANSIGTSQLAANSVTAAIIAANTITAAQIATGSITSAQIAASTITANQIATGTLTAGLFQAGIVIAGIINGTVVTGSTLQNSSVNPRTSINPDGSVSITNAAGVVVFSLGPDGTMNWYTQTGQLQMQLQPGGTTLIYAGATGPQSWVFEPPSATVILGTVNSATSAASYAITCGSAVPIGSNVMVWAACSGATSATTVVDSQGNTYTRDANVTTNQQLQSFYCASTTAALSTTDTITTTYAATNTQQKVIMAVTTPGLGARDAGNTANGSGTAVSCAVAPTLAQDTLFAVICDAAAGGAPSAMADGWQQLGTIGTGPYLTLWVSSTASAASVTASATIVSAAWAASLVGWKWPGVTVANGTWLAQNSSGVVNSTIAETTAWSTSGSWGLKVTSTGGATWGTMSPLFPVAPYMPASMQVAVYNPTALSAVNIGFNWYTSGGTYISSSAGDQGNVALTAGSVSTFTITGATAPSNATQARFFVQESATDAAGTNFSIDTVQVAGGLVYSLSPTSGTDALGNPYQQGLTFTGLAGLTNILAVQNAWGQVLAQIDGQGNVSGQSLSSATDVWLSGQSVSQWINSLPQGVLVRGWTPTTTPWPSTAIGTTETAILEVDQLLSAGRSYKLTVVPAKVIPTSATQYVSLIKGTTDGTTPTTSSTQLVGSRVQYMSAASQNYMTPVMEYIFPNLTSDTNYRILLTAYVQAGTFQYQSQMEMRIEDLGIWDAQSTSNNGAAIGTGTTGAAAHTNYTKTYVATATHCYYGATAANGHTKYGKRNDNSNIWQSCEYSPQDRAFYEGDQYSFIQFNYSQMRTDLAGATINSVKLQVNCNYSWYSTGMTVILGSSNYTGTFGDPFQPGGGSVSNQTSFHINNGQTLAQDITSVTPIVSSLASTFTAFMIGPASSKDSYTDQNNYGHLSGLDAANALWPRLIINYTK
jgi:hypothetical protein